MTVIRNTATTGFYTRWLMGALTASLCVAAGCDAPALEQAEFSPRPEAETSLRPGSNSGGWGSTRLNTPGIFKFHMGELPRDGTLHESPDDPDMRYTLVAIDLPGQGTFDITHETPLGLSQGNLIIEGTELSEELLLGARLIYEMEFPDGVGLEIGATVTGVMITSGPTGLIPLVNLEWDPALWSQFSDETKYPQYHDPDFPDDTPQLCPPASDANLWNVEEAKPMIAGNGYATNNFDIETAAVLYKDLSIGLQTADVVPQDMFMTIACLSGAAGKSALWGFPGWVGEDPNTGLSRFQQLQNSMAMIRFDVCGSGDPNTQEGTPVQIRDRWVGSFDFAGDTEAVWGLDGRAICIGTPRLNTTSLPMSCAGFDIPVCDASHEAMLDGHNAFAWTKRDTISLPPLPPPPIPVPILPGYNDCDVTSNLPGCNDPGVEGCVCAADPYCCNTAWDSLCVAQAPACEYSDACTAQPYPSPGTSNNYVEQCVCDADSYCCNVSWDSLCANQVESLGCGICS